MLAAMDSCIKYAELRCCFEVKTYKNFNERLSCHNTQKARILPGLTLHFVIKRLALLFMLMHRDVALVYVRGFQRFCPLSIFCDLF